MIKTQATTKKESQVLSWFIQEAKTKKRSCDLIQISLQDLAEELEIDPSNLSKYIQSLKNKGFLEVGYRICLDVVGTTCFNFTKL
jgi:DNA-binding MarR family transcriptional regulator